MIGNFFTEIINGAVAAQGFIQQNVGPGQYKVTFVPPPPGLAFSQILSADKMTGFVLFETKEKMDAWLKSLATPPKEDEQAEAPKPPAKPPTKGKAKS